jgi:hypothetical protein
LLQAKACLDSFLYDFNITADGKIKLSERLTLLLDLVKDGEEEEVEEEQCPLCRQIFDECECVDYLLHFPELSGEDRAIEILCELVKNYMNRNSTTEIIEVLSSEDVDNDDEDDTDEKDE